VKKSAAGRKRQWQEKSGRRRKKTIPNYSTPEEKSGNGRKIIAIGNQ